ncbi:MAG: hypothetical protein U0835_09565 [Isosphaeraceae bacterium]
MIDLPYSVEIEATDDPEFFGFHSPELVGFTGIGRCLEDCVSRARWGMEEHVELLRERGMPVPPPSPDPTIVVRNQRRRQTA